MEDSILQNTLNTEKTLPQTQEGSLSVFKRLLQTVSQKAKQNSVASGMSATGIEPSKISGGTLASVVNMVKGQKTQGIEDIYKSTIDMLDSSQKQANDQLKTLIDTGGITKLDDATLGRLAELSGTDVTYLKSIKSAKQDELSKKSSTGMTDLDRVTNLNQFLSEKIGDNGKITAKDYTEAYKKWITLNGSVTDFKYAYPVEEWVGNSDYSNLPEAWQPKSTKEDDILKQKEDVKADVKAITGSDGYADTQKVKQMRQEIALNAPELLNWFDAAYPPKSVLNPNDETAFELIYNNKW